jgi:hypothetical protein
MSIKNPCKKGRKRHRFDEDGYCVYCNKERKDLTIEERIDDVRRDDLL